MWFVYKSRIQRHSRTETNNKSSIDIDIDSTPLLLVAQTEIRKYEPNIIYDCIDLFVWNSG